MLRGRSKAEREHITVLAHQIAAMDGQLHSKSGLKSLKHYLDPPQRKSKADGTKDVLTMMRRIHKKKGGSDG